MWQVCKIYKTIGTNMKRKRVKWSNEGVSLHKGTSYTTRKCHCTSYFTFIYRPTRNIFLIPDDAVDRRKLGF